MPVIVDHFATASRFAIAAAIVYFAWQLGQIGQQLPPTLQEISTIRAEVTEVRKLIPDVLEEVSQTRQQIPLVLAQVDAVNRQIDPILQRVDNAVTVIDETQKQVPQILETTDSAILALNQSREEIVPLVPRALDEVKLTREAIDPTLDRVEELVEDTFFKASDAIDSAKSAGKEASEGAVSGFFTGLIKLPFKLVGSIASPVVKNIDKEVAKQLTEKDLELLVEAGERAVASDKLDKAYRWKNPDSGNSGSVTILSHFELQGLPCIENRIIIDNRKKKTIFDKQLESCKSTDGKWVLAENLGKADSDE